VNIPPHKLKNRFLAYIDFLKRNVDVLDSAASSSQKLLAFKYEHVMSVMQSASMVAYALSLPFADGRAKNIHNLKQITLAVL